LSLEGLVKAIKECNDESSNNCVTGDCVGLQDVDGIKLNNDNEEYSADAACNGDTSTVLQRANDGCSDGCNDGCSDGYSDMSQSGYCVACLSGDYPVALDW